VLRRLNEVLPFLVDEPGRSDRRSRLVRLMSRERLGPDVVTVPAEQRDWLASTAARMADGLASSGCTVHGDLALLGAPEPRGAARVGPGEVLAALVRMIHRVDAEAAPGQGGSR
jgi:hypothetical protein